MSVRGLTNSCIFYTLSIY